ncbi:hypothetical protein [Pseudomonas syringae]|uniref:hypothetical protein n=1 Tax=Pseudomonas syringae TaxID=317 RepID=UPI0006CB0205|nr:hypothetical protein [Pseudomonas syringae]ALE01042.1 hypothetical protein PSYRMG_25265 [Pseudomonas syringae UMAF0158]MCK9731909.1 hypothetical protein [Pseudomonas syringae pv. syringae]
MIHIENLHLTINMPQHLPVNEAQALSSEPDIEEQLRDMLQALDMLQSIPSEDGALTPVVTPLFGEAKDRAIDDIFEKLRVQYRLAERSTCQYAVK